MDTWEEKLDYAEEANGYEMNEVDNIQALLQMCPATPRSKLLEEQGKGLYLDYETLKDEVMYRVTDIQDVGGGKKWLGGVDAGGQPDEGLYQKVVAMLSQAAGEEGG